MTIQNKTFTTGNEYCIHDFFNGLHRIIIPDLQRDYCWGNQDNLVKNFINNLIGLFNSKESKKDIKMGLIYGYESPENHIQLCDGQQRLTTLFLLLGCINKYTKNKFQNNLIYDNDINEPYLQYAIRESTLYFLSDLVKYFFIYDAKEQPKLMVKDVKQQLWYFKDYDFDPSIQSMAQTLTIIEKELETLRIADKKIEEFGDFILNNLFFLYYDMGNRKNGEETFVIINTTGEALTPTENLKPFILSKKKEKERKYYSEQWEVWEDFFWKNRKQNDTADKGLNEFFKWVICLQNSNEDFKSIEENLFGLGKTLTLENIKQYFDIIEFIFNKKLIDNFDSYIAPEESNNQIILFKILPVIQYIYRFGNNNIKSIKRVIRFFYNMSRIDNVGKAIGELLPESIKIINELPNEDITSMLEIKNISKTLITEEERFKLELYKSTEKNRDIYEKEIWAAEDHPIWSGEIKALLLWSCKAYKLKINDFDISEFKKYYKLFTQLFYDNLDYLELDTTRRCLLTILPPDNYPKIFTGYTNYSFCWDYKDWEILIQENHKDFKKFLDKLNNQKNIKTTQEKMIENCIKEIKNGTQRFKYNLDQFIIYPELLSYCNQKNIQWSYEKNNWILIPQKRATIFRDLKTYTLYLEIIYKATFLNQKLMYESEECYSFSFKRIKWFIRFNSETNDQRCAFSTDDSSYIINCTHQKDDNRYELYTLNLQKEKNKPDQYFEEIVKKLKMIYNAPCYYLYNLKKKDIYIKLKEIITALSH